MAIGYEHHYAMTVWGKGQPGDADYVPTTNPGPCERCGAPQPADASFGRWKTEDRCISYKGAVLVTREENYRDDSDFYAVAWDEKTERCVRIDYDTTRFGGGGWASVDATDEVKAKAREWVRAWGVRAATCKLTREARKDAQAIKFGTEVMVTAKRAKVPNGTVGEVTWIGSGQWGMRVGFRTLNGETHFTAANNVGRVSVEIPNADVIKRDAERYGEMIANLYYMPFAKLAIL